MSYVSDWFRNYGFAGIYNNLVIGAYPLDDDDVEALAQIGVRQVVNLVEDDEYEPGQREDVARALERAGIPESRISLTDFGDLPVDTFEDAVQRVLASLDHGRRTYVHCRAGRQRSAAVAAGVVAVRSGMDIDNAVEFVRTRRPKADPLPNQRDDLRTWWASRGMNARVPPQREGARSAASSPPTVGFRDVRRGAPQS
jgi:atypical dual specificity phosphatase